MTSMICRSRRLNGGGASRPFRALGMRDVSRGRRASVNYLTHATTCQGRGQPNGAQHKGAGPCAVCGSAQFGQCAVWAVRSPAVRRLSLLCYFPYGRVLDAELLEIRFELLRVVVVLPHLRPVLRHDVRVEPRGRLVGRREERL